MFCRKCGAKLPENAKVCPACGGEETEKSKGILILAIVGVLILLLTVDLMHWNGNIWKLVTSVLVVVLNYIGSKLIVFRKSK